MFAALAFDRPPLGYQDLPGGVVSWVQDAGGYAAFALCLWLLVRFLRRRPAAADRPWPGPVRMLFLAALAGTALAYGTFFASKLPDALRALRGADTGPEAAAPTGPTRLEVWSMTAGGAFALLAV